MIEEFDIYNCEEGHQFVICVSEEMDKVRKKDPTLAATLDCACPIHKAVAHYSGSVLARRISPYDAAHVQKILAGYGSWFGADLLRLIARADEKNLGQFRIAFPDYVDAYENWDKGEKDVE